ncbi:DUF6630 family protein [Metabacillus fastidiosus]|uniref:DUF6630 domain-containing protein n=1 Tax=Metabacillus fastidiosus TaxID=1458 RepID=A0ABU6NY53_9BACI|nr:hypothetical protein [Metabacillus fastidiosus]MED4401578.1 hypothetical protein [Metabacillus fastidiosus]MED4463213.1 hypothetical protein [Metabacillus fastidiosus]
MDLYSKIIKEKIFSVKEAEEAFDYLNDNYYVAYIDWKLDFEDVVYNLNLLLHKLGYEQLELRDNDDLLGEEAIEYIAKYINNENWECISIDVDTDGLYIGIVNLRHIEELEKAVEQLGYKLYRY